MKNTILLLFLFAASLKGFSRAVPDTTVPFSSIPILYTSNYDSARIIGLVSLGNGLWANKTFWNIDLKKDRLRISDTSAMLSSLWSAINNRQASFTLTTTGTSGAATFSGGVLNIPQYSGGGGNSYNLNNWQSDKFTYSGSSTFTLSNSNPSRIYRVWVYNPSTPMNVPITANYTANLGAHTVTVNDALQSGEFVYVDYDIGTANGTIASGTPQNNYVPVWNSTSGTAVWGPQSGSGGGIAASNVVQNYLTGFNTWGLLAGDSIKVKTSGYAAGAGTVAGTDNVAAAIQKLDGNIQAHTTAIAAKQDALVSGTNIKTINGSSLLGSGNLTVGGGSGIASLTLTHPGVLFKVTTTGVNDGSGNWTLTDTLASQSAYTVLNRGSGSGTPSFSAIDSAYFGGVFKTEVQAASKYIIDTTLRTTMYSTYTGAWQMWVKPKGVSSIEFVVFGGGGGGGGGFTGATSTQRGGGGGGSSASMTKTIFSATVLPDTLWIFVGSGGTAGVASGAGGSGGTSYVSIQSGQTTQYYVVTYSAGGNGGAAGGATGTASGGTGAVSHTIGNNAFLENLGIQNGVGGANGSTAGGGGAGQNVGIFGGYMCSPGSGGGGCDASNVGYQGGNITASAWAAGLAGGTAGGGNGNNGYFVPKPFFTSGGTGGGGNGSGTGGTGGAGSYGAGGGGGGGGITGGPGGAGGNGVVIINAW